MAGLGLLALLFMFLFVLVPLHVHASTPIVFDSSATNNCACTSLSWSHTVGTGSNGILIVGLSGFKNDPATSVTFGPKSLSRVGNRLGFANVNVELWDLLNPSSACAPAPAPCTATVSVTITGGNILAGGSVSYFNVGGTGTVASADDGGIPGTTGSVTVSSSNSGDLVVDAFGAYNNVATPTASPGSSQSQRWNTGLVHPISERVLCWRGERQTRLSTRNHDLVIRHPHLLVVDCSPTDTRLTNPRIPAWSTDTCNPHANRVRSN